MKNFLFFVCSILAGYQISFSQTEPVIDAMYLADSDPFCYDGSSKILTIVVTDGDGDPTYVNIPTFTNNYLESSNLISSSTVGNTTTFYYEIYMSWMSPAPAGTLSFEDISVTAVSSGSDLIGVVNGSLTNVEVNGQIAVDFNVPYLEICSKGNLVDLTNYVVEPGGSFSYPLQNDYSSSPALNPSDAYEYYINNDYSFYINYSIPDVTGCIGTGYLSIDFFDSPEIVVTPTSSLCNSATGAASAEINNGSAPYQVYWSTGFSEISSGFSAVSNLSSGVYYINVEDANGCKGVGKANISDSDIIVSETITPVTCVGQNGSVALAITPGTGSVSTIFWSNGQTTPTLSSGPGEYSVQVHTTANCNFFQTYTIPNNALKVELSDYYSNTECVSTPNGAIYINTTGGSGSYFWNWTKNGVAFSTNDNLFDISGGVYQCTVLDGTGCSVTWSQTVETYNNVWLWINSITKPTCGNTDGAIDINIDPFGATPTVYGWSNGANTEDLTSIGAGTYTLTYADDNGCLSYLTVELKNELPYQPSICLLTVDSTLIYNMIVWEKDITQDVAGFNIYRETSNFGVFEKIAERPYALESFFQDNAASPVDRSWRYYISTYDACGGESYQSFIHKTIHAVSSTSNGVDFSVSWDDYEGINYSSVDILRFDNVNGWTTIANVLNTAPNVISDAPPVLSGLDYMVSFILTDPCTSTKAQDYNSSRSNKTASVFNAGGSTVQLEDIDLGLISIYPNPTNADLTLRVDNPDQFQYFEILDLNGRVILSESILTNSTIVSLNDFSNGIYLVRIVTDSKIIVEKIAKN